MNIIGHRGAAGLALENTLESIRSAIDAGVDAIEVDVRLTQDSHLVLSHDEHTERVSASKIVVNKTQLEDLQVLKLHNGKRMPTLKEAMRVTADTPLVIDAKGDDWARPLARLLHQNHRQDISVVAFNHEELNAFSLLCPHIPVYALEHTKPFEVIQTAQKYKFTGVDLNFWILNPLTYGWARRSNLQIIVYTVNSVWMARFLKFLYPHISITTNNPHKLGYLSDSKKSKRRPVTKARAANAGRSPRKARHARHV